MAKVRLVYRENVQGKPVSYFYVERSEAHRIGQILKILPNLKKWTPLQKLASRIRSDRVSTERTIFRLNMALRVDIETNGKFKVLARHLKFDIRKDEFNQRNNKSSIRFLRPTMYIRIAHC